MPRLLAFQRVHWCRLAGFRGYFANVNKIGVMLLPFGALPAFCPLCRFVLGAFPLNMPLFRVLRRFIWVYRLFAWVCSSWCFAWLVWLLCACGVRRIRDLLRVCLCFYPFILCFYPFAFRFLSLSLLFVLFALVVFLCPLALSLLFLFPLRMYTDKKKGRKGLSLASSLRVLWVFSTV